MRLLADFGDVLPLIIGIIALISWVANKIKESSNANAAGVVAEAPGEEADGDVRVQAEIDRFLQQVRGGGQSPAPAPEGTPTAPTIATVQKKTERLTERHVIGDRHIRSGVSDVDVDFDGDSDERMTRRVDRDLGHGVEQSVSSHMGPSVGDGRGSDVSFDSSDWAAENLVGVLTRPDGMRQAVLVHEILSRPKGRRGRSGP